MSETMLVNCVRYVCMLCVPIRTCVCVCLCVCLCVCVFVCVWCGVVCASDNLSGHLVALP